MALQAKLLPMMPTSPIRMLTHDVGKQGNMPDSQMEDLEEVSGSWLEPCSALTLEAIEGAN